MERFFGRTDELKLLKRQVDKRSASLIVVRGRRRIGKSRLIEEFAQGHHFLSFAGQPPHDKITAQEQRDEFVRQLAEQTAFLKSRPMTGANFSKS